MRFNYTCLEKKDVLLITSAPTPGITPYASIGYLGARFKAKNISVQLLDLGMDAVKWFLQTEIMKASSNSREHQELNVIDRYSESTNLIHPKEVLRNKDQIFKIFHEKYSSLNEHKKANDLVRGAMALYTSKEKGAITPLGNYHHPWSGLKLEDIFDRILNEEDIYRDFHQEAVRNILEKNYRLIGLSITHGDQLIPAFSMAKALKGGGYSGRILLGGMQISLLVDFLKTEKAFYRYVDWYCIRFGEPTIDDICDHLDDLNPEKIRNILFLGSSGQIQYTDNYNDPDLKTIIPPDYEGLLLEDYLVPETTLPIYSHVGCYWGKCCFCVPSCKTLYQKYQGMTANQVLDTMVSLNKKHNCRHFIFGDNATSPSMLTKLSELIIENKYQFFWYLKGLIPERSIDKEVLVSWAQAGCKGMALGLESASPRLLPLLGKRHSIEDTVHVLEAAYEAKIMVYVYTMFGHPLETEEDLNLTIEFLKKYRKYFIGFAHNKWLLSAYCADYRESERLGITIQNNLTDYIGKPFPALTWQSAEKKEKNKKLNEMLKDFGPRSYLCDWFQSGHGTHMPLEWSRRT